RRAHSMASSIDDTCHSQNPATSSLTSVNGPSTTRVAASLNCTRTPLELGCSPSPASMTPALTSSSLYRPITVSISSLGSTPASDSEVAFTSTITRIVVLLTYRRARYPHQGSTPCVERPNPGSTPAAENFPAEVVERRASRRPRPRGSSRPRPGWWSGGQDAMAYPRAPGRLRPSPAAAAGGSSAVHWAEASGRAA